MAVRIIPIRRMPQNLHVLHYNPGFFSNKLEIGQLISIPLRNKPEYGIVDGLNENIDLNENKIKDIKEIVIEQPLLNRSLLDFYKEISEFYNAPLGFILKMALLPLKKTKLSKISQVLTSSDSIIQKNIDVYKPIFISLNNEQDKIDFIKKIVMEKGQNLILCPDISSIGNIQQYLSKQTTKKIIIISGDISEKEYFDLWLKIKVEKDIIVIGTRKSIFLPWSNLTNIVITDEGNANYKSWEMIPRFHTRDASLMLSKFTGAKLYLESPSPSIETYYFSKQLVYNQIGNIENLSPPSPLFIDCSQEKKFTEKNNFLSQSIIDEINESSGNIFIHLDRKGTSKTVICKNCQFIYKCHICRKPMTYSENRNEFICQYCNEIITPTANCPECGQSNLKMLSPGTEGIASEIKRRIPHANTVILDSDNKINVLEKNTNNKKIIIGTKYAWALIDWNNINIMIFADPDYALSIPEFKSIEFLWQDIRYTQRKLNTNAKIIIQTSHINHHIYQGLYNPSIFYQTELTERQVFNYPPYQYLTRLIYCGKLDDVNKQTAIMIHTLQSLTSALNDVKISGPFYNDNYKKNKTNCSIIVIKISYKNYKKLMKTLMSHVDDKWKIDPNPNHLLALT